MHAELREWIEAACCYYNYIKTPCNEEVLNQAFAMEKGEIILDINSSLQRMLKFIETKKPY